MILREGIELYHASYKVVDKIDLSCCSEGKDFGKGFYLTSDFGQACKFVKTSIRKALVNGVDVENDRMGWDMSLYISLKECLMNYRFMSSLRQIGNGLIV